MPRSAKTHRPSVPGLRQHSPAEAEAIARRKAADAARPSAQERGYTSKWSAARTAYLARHPLCAEHERHGRTVAACVVDHIIPHRGDQKLFWDKANWQSLCKPCHDKKTGRGA